MIEWRLVFLLVLAVLLLRAFELSVRADGIIDGGVGGDFAISAAPLLGPTATATATPLVAGTAIGGGGGELP